MGSLTLILSVCVVFVAVYRADAASTGCPLASKTYSCSPKCQQNYDCSHGKICCPNSCNAKSCIDAAAFGNSGGNDKYSQSGGPGVYCNNVKCNAFEWTGRISDTVTPYKTYKRNRSSCSSCMSVLFLLAAARRNSCALFMRNKHVDWRKKRITR
ncbi:unnamed protein product, partial [Iphiclides podalirius]